MWEISKTFEFDYGHRVYTQQLKQEYSLDCELACRHLHGHRGKVIVYLKSDELDDAGMVTDFKHLNWFKKWVDEVLDHKFILGKDDPLFEYLTLNNRGTLINPSYFNFNKEDRYWTPRYDNTESVGELLEGIVIVPFVPTSENLAKWLYEIVSKKMKQINVQTTKIEFYETPKSKSVYSPSI